MKKRGQMMVMATSSRSLHASPTLETDLFFVEVRHSIAHMKVNFIEEKGLWVS